MPKPNLLLLHGALGASTELDQLKEYLSHHFLVFSFDFEGHGNSATSNDFSIDLFTGNLRQLIKSNNLDTVNIFGYSMGGYVALNYALSNPDDVNCIVTYGTKFNWTKDFAAKEIKNLNPDLIEKKVPKFATYLKSIHSTSTWKEVVHKTAGMMTSLGNAPTLNSNAFQNIKNPVLIAIGDLDHMVSVEESREVVSNLNNGELLILEGFVHPLEKNDLPKLSKIVLDFIKA